MDVGFITSVLWPRYGQFWKKLAADAGAELVTADPDEVQRQLALPFIRQIPSTVFRLATAEAVALANCDWTVTPHPNMGTQTRRGGAQDPWIIDFPEVLASAAGLQNLFAVPVRLDGDVEPLGVTFLQELMHDGWRTRKIMERHRNQLASGSRAAAVSPRRGTVGVVGQSWLVDAHLARLAVPDGTRILVQDELDPGMLTDEAARHHEGLPDSDLEVLGAVRHMTRRGGIERIVMLVDEVSQMDRWLAGQAARVTHKAFTEVPVQELLDEEELHRHLLMRFSGP